MIKHKQRFINADWLNAVYQYVISRKLKPASLVIAVFMAEHSLKAGPPLNASMISRGIRMKRHSVSRHLNTMAVAGLVDKVQLGLHRIEYGIKPPTRIQIYSRVWYLKKGRKKDAYRRRRVSADRTATGGSSPRRSAK